jgi:hypothetical protein
MTAVQIVNDDGTTTTADATVSPAVSTLEALTTELAVSAGSQRRLRLMLTTPAAFEIGGMLIGLGQASNGDASPVDTLEGVAGLIAKLESGEWSPDEREAEIWLEALAKLRATLEG